MAGAAAALAALAAVGRAVLTRREAKVRGTWKEKQRKNLEYKKRHPAPLLRSRILRKQIIRCKLMRRDDASFIEWAGFLDPREKQYQMSVEKTRAYLENPETVTMEQTRAKYGIPMPPFTLMDDAMKEMRGGAGANQPRDLSSYLPNRGKEKPKGQIDLSSVELDFVRFKGIELSKKQLAKLQANKN